LGRAPVISGWQYSAAGIANANKITGKLLDFLGNPAAQY
jgi:hypothetical protein